MQENPYARTEPSFVQRAVLWFLPGRREQIERESREWIATCPDCGLERSFWDLGGVRFGAYSKGKRTGIRCVQCGKYRMQKVEHRRP